METQTFTETLIIRHCHKCGITYGITQAKEKRCDWKDETVWCPNGHPAVYIESMAKTLAKAKARADREFYRRVAAQDQADASERRRRATAGHVTRLKNRIHKGVCPYCKRHFKNLQQHIETKHPRCACKKEQ